MLDRKRRREVSENESDDSQAESVTIQIEKQTLLLKKDEPKNEHVNNKVVITIIFLYICY